MNIVYLFSRLQQQGGAPQVSQGLGVYFSGGVSFMTLIQLHGLKPQALQIQMHGIILQTSQGLSGAASVGNGAPFH